MNPSSRDHITALLKAAHDGDTHAFTTLYELVYAELHRLAHLVRRGRAGATLNTTALVHEAYFKLIPSRDLAWQDRSHFFRVAARAMRQVLVNAAERRMAEKRGGGHLNITFDEQVYTAPIRAETLLVLNDALHQLERFSPRQAQVVECRFFAGLTVEETAEALGLLTPTVKRDWRTARAWLASTMDPA